MLPPIYNLLALSSQLNKREKLTKALVHPILNNQLVKGVIPKSSGHPIIHAFSTLTVPNLFCRGGKTTSCHKACDTPMMAKKMEIIAGENSHPPSSMDVK